jgi:3-hydroxyisobutyrate dehydrogenase-like beta-hydroxyacid dehydrogenase
VLEAADLDLDALTGTTILNTTSGTPEDARIMRDWARAHDIPYLDAAIAAYPEQLGTESARLLVAGDEALWRAHQAVVLDLAGSSMHVGSDHSAANALDCAMTGAFYITALTAFLEAARFTNRFGVSHDVLAELTGYSLSVMDVETRQILARIRDREFTTDQATLTVYADAAAAFAAGLNEYGTAPMIQTTAQVLQRAVEAGLGHEDIAAVFTLDS